MMRVGASLKWAQQMPVETGKAIIQQIEKDLPGWTAHWGYQTITAWSPNENFVLWAAVEPNGDKPWYWLVYRGGASQFDSEYVYDNIPEAVESMVDSLRSIANNVNSDCNNLSRFI